MGAGGCGLVAKNFFSREHENLFWKSYSEMSLKKVMYNQHDSYMHTPISAFACYDTPLQASYQSDTCKRRTISTKRITNKRMVGVWLSCHLPLGSIIIHSGEPPRQSPLCPPLSKLMRKKSHWRTVMCVSGLFPDLHLPTHFIAVTTSRTTSTLHDLSPPLLSMFLVNIPA